MEEIEVDSKGPVLTIEIVDAPPLSEEYKALREDIWKEKVQKWNEAGKELFNGTPYRFMGSEENDESTTIKLSLMTYADRLVRTKLSREEIIARFGEDYVMKNCCVDAMMVTTDGKIVVGVKKNSVDLIPGKIAYVGGNLNADEVKVNNVEDIFTMMMKEIGEESAVVPDRNCLSFAKLGVTDTWASFYFIYRLGIPSEEVGKIYKDDEFAEFIAMTPEEIANTDRAGNSDFNLSKGWIKEIV